MPDLAAPRVLREQAGFLYATEAIFINNATNEVYSVGAPQEFPVYDEGIQDEIVSFVKDGETNPSGVRRTGNEPSFEYQALYNPGSLALARGKEFVSQTVATPLHIPWFLIEAATMDIGGLNVDGESIPDDIANGIGYFRSATTPLASANRVPFANTPAAGEFAQGAGRNFKWDATDVGKQFTYFAPNRGTQAIDEATETEISSIRIYQEYILTENRILVLDAPTCVLRPGAGPLISGNPVTIRALFVRDSSICTIGPRIYFKGASDLYLKLC